MKAIVVMFDSLNRNWLPPYGCDWVHAPNFRRLAERTVTFDNSYVCSMPCMPARREMHTARPNFLHRSWGPVEPFDDSVPEILKENGVYTHLVSDHYHYWEEGGCNYHTRFSTWEAFRGQEGDPWIGQVREPDIPDAVSPHDGPMWRRDWVNRSVMDREELQPQSRTFAAGIDFLQCNHDSDNWLLQIETFDPHEPFFTQRHYKDFYADHHREYDGRHFDWPPYRKREETDAEVEHCRHEYAALLSMCDARLGDVLDTMDKLNLWDDTLLIVCTDHGFMLGEHDCWAKCWQPFYQEIAHTPFFVWDPRSKQENQRRNALVQPSLDIGPTVLRYFDLSPTSDMLGKDLGKTVAEDAPVRDAALFGLHGGHVNVTDGRYVYMRAPATAGNRPLFEYTLMPTHMRRTFSTDELAGGKIELADPFSFTKDCQTMKIPGRGGLPGGENVDQVLKTQLFDVKTDPRQESPIDDPQVEQRMINHLVRLMKACDAPCEQYERLGLTEYSPLADQEAVLSSSG